MDFLTDPKKSNEKLKSFCETHEAYIKLRTIIGASGSLMRDMKLDDDFHECTRAVFAIPEDKNEKLLLIKSHKRGWEFPGVILQRRTTF